MSADPKRYVEGGTAVLHRERGTNGGMAALKPIARVPAGRVKRLVRRGLAGRRKRAPRSVPDISPGADATLPELGDLDSRPEARQV